MPTAETKRSPVAPCSANLRAEVLDVAQGMLDQAQQHEWQTVDALHARLGRLLYKLLSRPNSEEAELTRTTLETVMSIAQSVSTLASKQRQETIEQLRIHRSHRAAADLYAREATP